MEFLRLIIVEGNCNPASLDICIIICNTADGVFKPKSSTIRINLVQFSSNIDTFLESTLKSSEKQT